MSTCSTLNISLILSALINKEAQQDSSSSSFAQLSRILHTYNDTLNKLTQDQMKKVIEDGFKKDYSLEFAKFMIRMIHAFKLMCNTKEYSGVNSSCTYQNLVALLIKIMEQDDAEIKSTLIRLSSQTTYETKTQSQPVEKDTSNYIVLTNSSYSKIINEYLNRNYITKRLFQKYSKSVVYDPKNNASLVNIRLHYPEIVESYLKNRNLDLSSLKETDFETLQHLQTIQVNLTKDFESLNLSYPYFNIQAVKLRQIQTSITITDSSILKERSPLFCKYLKVWLNQDVELTKIYRYIALLYENN